MRAGELGTATHPMDVQMCRYQYRENSVVTVAQVPTRSNCSPSATRHASWTTTRAAIGVAMGVLVLAQAGCEPRPGSPAQAATSGLPGSMPTREARTGLPPDAQQQAAEANIRPAVQPASSLGRVNPDPSALPTARTGAAETPSSTAHATGRATITAQPTGGATAQPTNSPTAQPTNSPTAQPANSPTAQPSPSPKPRPTTVASATAQPQPTSVAATRVPAPNQPGAWLGLFTRKP